MFQKKGEVVICLDCKCCSMFNLLLQGLELYQCGAGPIEVDFWTGLSVARKFLWKWIEPFYTKSWSTCDNSLQVVKEMDLEVVV